MPEVDRESLMKMYIALYGAKKVKHVPLRYTQFHQVQAFDQVYTSVGSKTSRSPVIIAIWPYLSDILTFRRPTTDNV